MPNFTKITLSTSLSGEAKAVGTSLTTIHTTASASSTIDEIWLYATNTHSADTQLTLKFGGTTVFQGILEAYAGNVLVCPGLIAKGNGTTGLVVQGEAPYPPPGDPVPSIVNVFGYVNRIS